jgi:Tol biopolymer transport system component
MWESGGHSIVFASNRGATLEERNTDGGQWSIYVIGINGRGLRRVTPPDGCRDDDPVPSPNGDEIAFVRSCDSSSGGDLMVVSSKGGTPRLLAARLDDYQPVTELAWSPDGRLIAYPRIRHPADPDFSPDDLWMAEAATGQLRRVAQAVGGFAWSHDGRKLAFGCGDSLCVRDMRSGTTRRTPRHLPAGNDVSSVAWSADDKQLAFVDGSGGSYQPNYTAWIMSSDGKRAHRLPRYGEGNVDNVQWLPRHPQVLVIESEQGVYLLHADGTGKADFPDVYYV